MMRSDLMALGWRVLPRGFSSDDVVGAARPGDGDTDVLGEVSARVGQVAAGFSTFRYELGRAEASLSSLSSLAVSRVASKINRCCAVSFASLQEDAEHFARGMSVYRSNLVDLQSRQRVLLSQIEDALWECVRHANDLANSRGMTLTSSGWRWNSWGSVQVLPHNTSHAGGGDENYIPNWHRAVSELVRLRSSWQVLVRQRCQANANFLSLMRALVLFDKSQSIVQLASVAQAISSSTGITQAILAEIYQLLSGGSLAVGEVRELCGALTPDGLQLLAETYPELIGNLDGVPFWARDQANRILLIQMLNDPGIDSQTLKRLTSIQDSLNFAEKNNPGENVQLLVLDFSDESYPKVAISLGDVDTANYVTPLTFGINTNVDDLSNCMRADQQLHQMQESYIPRSASASVATVMWLGYDSGNVFTVYGEEKARAGGVAFASFLSGTEANNPNAYVVPVAHSYGTRMASYALSAYGAHTDRVVFLGSPGLSDSASNASAMNVPAGNVFASRSEQDDISGRIYGVGQLGLDSPIAVVIELFSGNADYASMNPDPIGMSGVKTFDSATPGGGHDLLNSSGKGYFEFGSSGLDKTAKATLGMDVQ